MKKTITIILSGIIVLLLLGAFGAYFSNPEIFNCFTVNFSGSFDKLDNNIYVSKDTSPQKRDSILSIFKKADKRVCNFWETSKRLGSPVIIYCNSENLLSKFSPYKGTITYKTPLGCYIALGKSVMDLDILSHELFHTELFARIGYSMSIRNIPVWFDEGLAMQVDYRKDFSEEKYNEKIKAEKSIPKLNQISTTATFWRGNFHLNYLIARHEVDNWLKKSGKQNLFKFIERINKKEEFATAYSNN